MSSSASSSHPWHIFRKLGFAVRESWQQGYTGQDFRSDCIAGLITGTVAVPLGMALAIASGVQPQNGLYTVIVAGLLAGLLGGSRFSVTGPTAAFVGLLLPVVLQHGIQGLFLAGAMAGVMLLLMGLSGLGRWVRLLPFPVMTGFTSGIALVIATLQVKDFLGLKIVGQQETYAGKIQALWQALPSWSWTETSVATLTLAVLFLWPRVSKKVPAPIVALSLSSLLVFGLSQYLPSFHVMTVGDRFQTLINGEMIRGIPQSLPVFDMSWSHVGWAEIHALLPSAFAIALLGAIESLLCSVIADGMTQTRHDPDAELMAMGVANIIAPMFGAIPATGALARTATNIRFGARSPLATMIHALFALLTLVVLAPWLAYLPMAALAALLLLVAYNMSEMHNFKRILRIAPRSDIAVLMASFVLTVSYDMTIGVGGGLGLAALLFLRRISRSSSGKYHSHQQPQEVARMPEQTVLYEISGPLFFGAAEQAMQALNLVLDEAQQVVIDLSRVPTLDVSGYVILESSLEQIQKTGRKVILLGLQGQPMRFLRRSQFLLSHPDVRVIQSLNELTQA